MQGDPEIIEFLNEALTAELTAVNQYFIHSRMCRNWGFDRLAAKHYEESIDEMKDADELIERILYLEGLPNMQRLNPVGVGEDVREQFQVDLELEKAAIERYNRGIALALAKGDSGTRELLEARLVGEEAHADWLETQLSMIDAMGLGLYLSTQVGE